ncbi:MAG: hypothetical protein NUV64_03445 [Parcubacteria group bacterium]|nr:hypothetical protein [Parcubacteria group bacterium]
MLKIKDIKVSGFRGILTPKEFQLQKVGEKEPRSLMLFGVNSSGKTSFVDGLEWFFSTENKIEWLQREDAAEHAYYHHKAEDGNSYVELSFYDDSNQLKKLRKTFNQSKITIPTLSSVPDFEKLYSSFVIKPHLRYLEIVSFVLHRTGSEKYKELSKWMGFEDELAFQEKIAFPIAKTLKDKITELSRETSSQFEELKKILGFTPINEADVLKFCNSIFAKHKISITKSIEGIDDKVIELGKLQAQTNSVKELNALSQIETYLSGATFDSQIFELVTKLKDDLKNFSGEQEAAKGVNAIDLYDKALMILSEDTKQQTICPVCGKDWDKADLLSHIRKNLDLLKKVKEDKEKILESASEIRKVLRRERELLGQVITKYGEAAKISTITTKNSAMDYRTYLDSLETATTDRLLFEKENVIPLSEPNVLKGLEKENEETIKQIAGAKVKLELSKEAIALSDDIEKTKSVKQIGGKWDAAKKRELFFTDETKKFQEVTASLNSLISEGISNRFGAISKLIEEYFKILRKDKDIKDIRIVPSETKRAAGRSAEFQLSYYEIQVKPAYKILSESLLNSLGLSIYFACVRTFNKDCKFMVLDDIINSLDVHHRGTIIDLLAEKFSDFQIILFTHDDLWFERLQTKFPDWVRKKIRDWNYAEGPVIDFAKTTKEQLDEMLKDGSMAKEAGSKFGEYLEGVLNELCENFEAKLKYRYTKRELPTMRELFDALLVRLREVLQADSGILKLIKATWEDDLTIRNFCDHDRRNYASSISVAEVKSCVENWFLIEDQIRCVKCREFPEYIKAKGKIYLNCPCDNLKLPIRK